MTRKTPCEPILNTQQVPNMLACRYCARPFASRQSLSRHTKHRCKIANSEEGMEKLFEHTLQRQVAEQSKKIGVLEEKIDELTSLLKNGAALSTTTNSNSNNNNNSGAQVYTQNSGPTTININPWGRELYFSAQTLEAAFASSETLQRYCHIGLEARTDPEEAAPYVQEVLMSLVKRVHQDPQERNVYLNPKRTDQVLIYDEVTWVVLPLIEAIRSLFDRVSRGIHKVTSLTGTERQKLSQAVAESAPWIPIMYDECREKHIVQAKPSMAAHLENMTPGRVPSVPQPIRHEASPPREKPVAEKPQTQKKAPQPPPFTAIDAANLLRTTKIKKSESRADYARKMFESARDQEPGRIMAKLWEAQEEGHLTETEAIFVRTLVSEYDAGTLK